MNFFVAVTVLSILYLAVAALERVPALRFRPIQFLRAGLATDLAWYGVAVTNSAISVFVFRPQLSKLAIAPISKRVNHIPAPARLLLALVLFDLVAFAVHLGLHRSDRLWAFHKVHHSSLQLDWLAATRAHMFENLIRFVAAQMILYLIGIPVGQVAVTTAIFAAFALLDHGNLGINLRWAEAVFVTPRLHRRHHVPATTQRNFGAVFSIWDRLLGKLDTRNTGPGERFGVPGEIDTYPQRFAAAFRQPVIELSRRREPIVANADGRATTKASAGAVGRGLRSTADR